MTHLGCKSSLFIFLLLACIFPFSFAIASDLEIKWEQTVSADGLDIQISAIKSVDNNLTMAGKTYSKNKYGLWLAKYDFSGKEIFQKTYAVENGFSAFNVNAIINAENESILVLGTEYAKRYAMWLRKFDKMGNLIFKKLFPHSKSISPGSIVRTDDGNFIITGTEEFKDVVTIKIDGQGNIIWEKIYKDESKGSIALSTMMRKENILNISVVGQLSKFGTGDSTIRLTKLDAQGQKIKDFVFPGRVTGFSQAITSDGAKELFYLSYDSPPVVKGDVCDTRNVGENEMNVMCFNSDLEKVWNKSYGKKMTLLFAPLINRMGDNYVLAGGFNPTMKKIEPAWLAVIDKNGDKICSLPFKNQKSLMPNAIIVNSNNNLLLVGTRLALGGGVQSEIVMINIEYKSN